MQFSHNHHGQLLKEVQAVIDKGFDPKDKEIAAEVTLASRRLAEVVHNAQAELGAISTLSMKKDSFSAVLKSLYDKLVALEQAR